jgi:hypothetical protein
MGQQRQAKVVKGYHDEHGTITIYKVEPGERGCHEYEMWLDPPAVDGKYPEQCLKHRLFFQRGPVEEVGFNGFTEEAVLAILIDRYREFQATKWKCRENAITITKLEEALMWQQRRSQRIAEERQPEGTD